MADAHDSFQRFLVESARFWQRAARTQPTGSPAPDAPVILVDLMADHPQYYLTNLVVAKYLQRISGARLIGLVDTMKRKKVILVARSFGVEAIHAVTDMAAGALADDLPQYAERLRPLEGAALRRAVLDLTCDGMRIGDLVYDTYLRAAKQATIATCSRELLLELSLGLNTVRTMRDILARYPRIEATVVGHVCYVLFGVLWRAAEERGATVHFVMKMKHAVSMHRYSAVPKDERFPLRICPDQVQAAWAGDRERAVRRGKALVADRMAGAGGRQSGMSGGFDPGKPVVPVPTLFGRPDNQRTGRPVLCVMASSLADAPHTNVRNIYDDQLVWLDETLRIACDMPAFDWIIKLHPYTGMYVDRRQVEALVMRRIEGKPNMRLMPETTNTRSLVGAIDGLITPWGTSGLEFATLGVPVVTAGNTYYSGLGFAVEARTPAEYRAAIEALPTRRPDAEAAARAAIAAWLFFEAALTDCHLLPDVEMLPWLAYDESALWDEAAGRLAANTLADDPLYQRIVRYQAETAPSL